MMKIQLTINNQPYQSDASTVAQLVTELGYVNKRIAVELNGEIIVKSQYETTVLPENATIEIVNAVGGG